MKTANKLIVAILCASLVVACAPKASWTNIFDGKTLNNWHSYGKSGTSGWMVMDGALMTHGKSGDLVSNEEFENFDFEFEFKVKPKGNSGIMYKVVEDPAHPPYHSGPEYQIIDDTGYPPFNDNGKMVSINDKQKTGANYDMQPPSQFVTKPAGEWNTGRIKIKDNQVEHWVNGVKVVDYVYGGDTWKEQLAKSKFKTWAYATPRAKGKIALQDHGDEVWFRNMRIRRL